MSLQWGSNGEVRHFSLSFALSSSCKGNNATDILIGGIITRLVTVAGDKLPSQGQPYCSRELLCKKLGWYKM